MSFEEARTHVLVFGSASAYKKLVNEVFRAEDIYRYPQTLKQIFAIEWCLSEFEQLSCQNLVSADKIYRCSLRDQDQLSSAFAQIMTSTFNCFRNASIPLPETKLELTELLEHNLHVLRYGEKHSRLRTRNVSAQASSPIRATYFYTLN